MVLHSLRPVRPLVPLGAVLFATCPMALRVRFRRARVSNYVLGDIQKADVRAIRWEVLLIAAFFAAIFWLLDLRWQNTLVLYACFAFNWSTRQYVGHAYTQRDVIEGSGTCGTID